MVENATPRTTYTHFCQRRRWPAVFNTTLSGLTFVLEEVQWNFHPMVFVAAFIARLIAGSAPVFEIASYPAPPIASLPFFALLGRLAGPLGVLLTAVKLAR